MISFFVTRKNSFRNAFNGLGAIILGQVNFRIHLAILAVVFIAGLILNISITDWTAIIIVAGLVLAAECFNTALEYLGDAFTKEDNPFIGKAKDVAAAGVLLSSVTAAAVGLIVFVPALLKFLK